MNNEIFYIIYMIITNQLSIFLDLLICVFAFAGYFNALLVFLMYAFNKIKLNSNKTFWRSILIPGYLLFKNNLKTTEEKHI